MIDIDYWLGITECVCNSEYPIGGCLKCDLLRIQKRLAEFEYSGPGEEDGPWASGWETRSKDIDEVTRRSLITAQPIRTRIQRSGSTPS